MKWVRLSSESGHIVPKLSSGGRVVISGTATSPVSLRRDDDAVYFGPLGLRVSSGDLWIDRLRFLRRPSSPLGEVASGLPFGAATTLAAIGGPAAVQARAEREGGDSSDFSRREVILSAGVLLGGAAATTAEAAQQDILTVAELDLDTNEHGATVILTDEVADVLPPDREYLLMHEGTEIGRLSPSQPSTTLPAGRVGTVSVLTPSDTGFMQTLRDLITLDGREPVEFQAELSKPAGQHDRGETVAVTRNEALVRPVANTDNVVVTLGGRSVPSRSESSHADIGYYHTGGDALYYTAGPDPPDATTLTIAAGVSTLAELQDDVSRSV